MKKIIAILFIIYTASCTKLDLNPLSEGSSENWYSDETEMTLSLNDLYRTYLWALEMNLETERMTDNWTQRQAVHVFSSGAITSEWNLAEEVWLNTYKGITRANTILNNLDKAAARIPEAKLKQLAGEAHFFRAVFYGRLVFLFGDVPFYTDYLDIEKAFTLRRTGKDTVLQQVYEDFDKAIDWLPESYGSTGMKRATKGAALAFKARTALYMGDWEIARDAAKACMDLNIYSLHPDFEDYFLTKTRNSPETIFALPQSLELGQFWTTTNFYPRTPGGSAVAVPSWELFAAFPCTDGLPIDESPLYDPRNPFQNRDPRCTATIVEFGTPFLGFIYDPNPYATQVLNLATNTMVSNKDTRSVDQFASYNGLALKKGVDSDWSDDKRADFDIKIMRYADVLLMYAEAKIELNEIDASVLEAINRVRARAYKVDVTATTQYPAITTTNQTELRNLVRNERRIELAWENRRFDDIIRWRIAEKVLTKPIYGMLDPNDLKSKIVDQGLWFFPGIPEIDDEWLPDYSQMAATGLIKVLVERNFDKTRQYLWPIPSKEIIINKNLVQNPNY
jgi:hypothetical protein